jgi:predicted permease
MTTLFQDLRYALRTLRRTPAFTAAAVLTLALGIGAVTAIFSVVDEVLLRPLPYHEPDRLASIWPAQVHSKGELLALQERGRILQEVAAYTRRDEFSLTGHGDPARLQGSLVSANVFTLLRTPAALGRTFLPGEDRAGGEDVVVMSHGLWERLFGSDPTVVGRPITVNGRSRTVVGVMPRDFGFPAPETELWVPLSIDAADAPDLWGVAFLRLIGRLQPGATPELAAAEVRALVPELRERTPWPMPDDYGADAGAVSLKEELVGNLRTTLLVLLAAVGFVLLIACANIANLLLARAAGRQRELAVRAALGAGRGRLIRQLLTECVLLATIGGVAGVMLAAWSISVFGARLPVELARSVELSIDGRVLGFAGAATLFTALGFGLLPALRASRPLQGLLRGGARGIGAGAPHRRLTSVLVAAEIAVAVILVSGAGLLIRSLWQLQGVDPGFRADNVVVAQVAPPPARYDGGAKQHVFYAELLEQVSALPGVERAAAASSIPFGGDRTSISVAIEGYSPPPGAAPPISVRWVVTPGYFATVGIPLRQGRDFSAADGVEAPGLVIVSETFARRFWPDQDPLGKRLRVPWVEQWWTVVGIAGDVHQDDLAGEIDLALYRPYAQDPIRNMTLAIRTGESPQALAANLRAVVGRVDKDTPVSRITTLRQMVSKSLARPRFATMLLAAFALLALLLGSVGVYGVMSYAVSQQTRELGVRIALGAQVADIRRQVLRRGALLAGAGIITGIAGALAVTRLLRGLLFGVGPSDPLTFVVVSILLAGVALLASYPPARRAMRVDPMAILRAE